MTSANFSRLSTRLAVFAVALTVALISISAFARGGGAVAVRGYYRSNGTYVAPHMRSAPDGDFSNNWSTYGNVNPYTGQPGTKITPPPGQQLPTYYSPPTSLPSGNDDSAPSSNGTPEKNSYSQSHQTKLPPHAKLNYLGNDWECERGFYRFRNECREVTIPENAKLNYLGNDWECNRGFFKARGECREVVLPANSRLTYLGNDWECNRGYRKYGSYCQLVDIPSNGKLTYLGNDWECESGYKKRGSACEIVELPENSHLTYLGNDWECDRGFQRRLNKCTPVGIEVHPAR